MATPQNQPTVPKNAANELGASGTIIANGIITQEEYNADLFGIAGIRKYEIMRRSDSTVRAALQVVKQPILSTTWEVKPAQQEDGTISDVAKTKADYISRELFKRNVNWHDFIRQALTFTDFGFSCFEMVLNLTDYEGQTLVGVDKLGFRKQISVRYFSTSDNQPGIRQYLQGRGTVDIPREKLIMFTHDQEGDNFAGISLLRYIYKDWDMKDKLTLVNAMALEKLGIGVPVVQEKDGQSATEQDRADAREALANMRANNNAYLEIPNTMMAEMMDMKANTTKEIIPTLDYHDGRIMKSILAGFLELGGRGSGSQSLSKDLSSLFMKAEVAVANIIVAAVQNDLIKKVCDLNWSDMSEGYPQLAFGQIADDDVDTMATALSSLAGAGLIQPDAEVENHLRRIYRLPEMTADQIAQYEAPSKTPDPSLATPPPDTTPPPADPKKDVKAAVSDAERSRRRLIGMLAEG